MVVDLIARNDFSIGKGAQQLPFNTHYLTYK